VDVLISATLPALLASTGVAGIVPELHVFTDQGDRVRRVVPDNVPLRLLPVPGPDRAFESLSNCHRKTMTDAVGATRVLLLTADMVISREVFATCEQWLGPGGKQIVCCVAPRVTETRLVPIGAPGRELAEWGWANRHPMTRECTWPEGRSYDVWRMYFEQEGEVSARVFLPHPLAVLPRGRRLEFRPTIDVNLASNFSRASTHMITNPEEGTIVELSPVDKDFLLTTTMRERMVDTQHSCPAFIPQTNQRHRMFFGHRVVLCGAGGDCGDAEVVGRMLG
jgi:hypothetical protein